MTENVQAAQVKLPSEIQIAVDGQPFSVFMSFALLNRICYLMGDAAQIPLILQDPELREAVLVECLAIRDAKGKVQTRRALDEMALEFDGVQDLLEFVSEHVADFTVGAVERATKVMRGRQDRIAAIQTPAPSSSTASQTGSAD